MWEAQADFEFVFGQLLTFEGIIPWLQNETAPCLFCRDCNVPALLNEASFFGLTGLEAALQVMIHYSETLQLQHCFVMQEHAKAEEERIAKQQQDPRTGDEFLLNVGGEVTLF